MTTLPASRRERGNQKGMRCRAVMFDRGLTVETNIKGKERDVQNGFNYSRMADAKGHSA